MNFLLLEERGFLVIREAGPSFLEDLGLLENLLISQLLGKFRFKVRSLYGQQASLKSIIIVCNKGRSILAIL